MGVYRNDGESLFRRACWDRSNGNGSHPKEETFNLDIRTKFFTMRLVKHYCRLPRELVNASFLEMFKGRLVGALNNLMWLMMYLVLKLLYYFMINSSNAWVKTQVGYTEGNMHENIFWFFTVSCEKAPPVHKIRNISCPANYTKLFLCPLCKDNCLNLYLSPRSF